MYDGITGCSEFGILIRLTFLPERKLSADLARSNFFPEREVGLVESRLEKASGARLKLKLFLTARDNLEH